MKIIITESQKKLLFENSINDSLIDMIKTDGLESAVELVGGSKNLMKVLKIKTPMSFLNLFNDLDVVQSEEKPDWTLFRYVKGKNMVVYDRKNGYAYVNYYDIWSFLRDNFGLKYSEIQELIKEWLGEVYNLRVNTATVLKFTNIGLLGEVYNLRVNTANSNFILKIG